MAVLRWVTARNAAWSGSVGIAIGSGDAGSDGGPAGGCLREMGAVVRGVWGSRGPAGCRTFLPLERRRRWDGARSLRPVFAAVLV
jgi:hypothetical protein